MPQPPGEGADLGVVALHGGNEILARDGDAVLGTFKLRLQGEEVLIGFKVRVTLGHHHQATQGPGQLRLGLLELAQLLGIVQGAGIDLDRGRLGPGFYDRGQGFLLLLGVAFDRFDQIGNQVGAALVLVLHLGPGRFYLLVIVGDVVDPATGQQAGKHQQQPQSYALEMNYLHVATLLDRRDSPDLRHNPSSPLDRDRPIS
ncbi:hypothetical protein D9M71_304820 [compost metagenome]